jgi:HTH-type transcriptional regulator, glycine betaine synthesis regulator
MPGLPSNLPNPADPELIGDFLRALEPEGPVPTADDGLIEHHSSPLRLPPAEHPAQLAFAEFFADLADAFGFPPSVGSIYGLLYSSEEPLCLADVVRLLGISKGSASQGLAALRTVGAVRPTLVTGSRAEHYVPEISLRRLVGGMLREKLQPKLDGGEERLQRIEALLTTEEGGSRLARPGAGQGAEGSTLTGAAFQLDRLRQLRAWRKKTKTLLPLIARFLG